MAFEGAREIPILELGISQIYLSVDKVRAVEAWLDPAAARGMEPLPVYDFGNGRYTLTDGHTRAYVAFQRGIACLPVVYDTDDLVTGEMGGLLYRTDIEWCERFHLKDVSDLQDRIVAREAYERLWIGRCERSFRLLSRTTPEEREALRQKAPSLYLYGASEDASTLFFEDAQGARFVYRAGWLLRER